MAIDYHRLMDRKFPDIEQAYSFKDTILSALGLGPGQDPQQRRHT
jgi:hypothetical protein